MNVRARVCVCALRCKAHTIQYIVRVGQGRWRTFPACHSRLHNADGDFNRDRHGLDSIGSSYNCSFLLLLLLLLSISSTTFDVLIPRLLRVTSHQTSAFSTWNAKWLHFLIVTSLMT